MADFAQLLRLGNAGVANDSYLKLCTGEDSIHKEQVDTFITAYKSALRNNTTKPTYRGNGWEWLRHNNPPAFGALNQRGWNIEHNPHFNETDIQRIINILEQTKGQYDTPECPPQTPGKSHPSRASSAKTPASGSEPPSKRQRNVGGSNKVTYKGRSYTVRTGSKGGKYILVQDKKIYV